MIDIAVWVGAGIVVAIVFAASTLLGFLSLLVAGVGMPIVQIALLSRDGQTIGKRLLKIKVVRVDSGRNGGFVSNVLLRAVVNGLLSLTVVYFVVDVLFIFFGNRLCLHDYIAGTRVVRTFDARAPVRIGREARRRTR